VFGKVDHKQTNSLAEATHLYESPGQAIRATDWFKLPPQSVLVIMTIWIAAGEDRLRLSGSAGAQWHENDRTPWQPKFPRLRIGIEPQVQPQVMTSCRLCTC